MNHLKRYQGGFTLVEIMVVVAVIGLLAAMAYPSWYNVHRNAISATMDNDARQLASAAQQYFLESGATTVPVGYADGVISGPLATYVQLIGSKYSSVSKSIATTGTFSLAHPALPAPRNYSPEGQYSP